MTIQDFSKTCFAQRSARKGRWGDRDLGISTHPGLQAASVEPPNQACPRSSTRLNQITTSQRSYSAFAHPSQPDDVSGVHNIFTHSDLAGSPTLYRVGGGVEPSGQSENGLREQVFIEPGLCGGWPTWKLPLTNCM